MFKKGDRLVYTGSSASAPKESMKLTGKPYLVVDYIKNDHEVSGLRWVVFMEEPMRKTMYNPDNYPNGWRTDAFERYEEPPTFMDDDLFTL